MEITCCPHCNSERFRKDGISSNGSQIYRCKSCNRRFSDHSGALRIYATEPKCPHCNSNDIKYRGWNKSGTRRYECNKCGQCFSGPDMEIQKKKTNCPHCESKNITYNGWLKDGTRRYRCKDCGKYFSDKTVIKEPINVTCKKCGSNNVGTHGKTEKGKQIYQCRDCHSRFVLEKEIMYKKHDIICPKCGKIGARKAGNTGKSSIGGIKQYYICLSCGHKYLLGAVTNTQEDTKHIQELYDQQVPVRHIAEMYNTSEREIYRKVQGRRSRLENLKKINENINKDILNGMTVEDIAKKYNYSIRTIRDKARESIEQVKKEKQSNLGKICPECGSNNIGISDIYKNGELRYRCRDCNKKFGDTKKQEKVIYEKECPKCNHVGAVSAGKATDGRQYYKCVKCNHKFTENNKFNQLSNNDIKQIHKLYKDGLSVIDIAHKFNVCEKTIRNKLQTCIEYKKLQRDKEMKQVQELKEQIKELKLDKLQQSKIITSQKVEIQKLTNICKQNKRNAVVESYNTKINDFKNRIQKYKDTIQCNSVKLHDKENKIKQLNELIKTNKATIVEQKALIKQSEQQLNTIKSEYEKRIQEINKLNDKKIKQLEQQLNTIKNTYEQKIQEIHKLNDKKIKQLELDVKIRIEKEVETRLQDIEKQKELKIKQEKEQKMMALQLERERQAYEKLIQRKKEEEQKQKLEQEQKRFIAEQKKKQDAEYIEQHKTEFIIDAIFKGQTEEDVATRYNITTDEVNNIVNSLYKREVINKQQQALIINYGIGCNVPVEYIAPYVPCSIKKCNEILQQYKELKQVK